MFARTLPRHLLSLSLILLANEGMAAHCVYLNSYHSGYEWGDRIQQQFEKEMNQQCRITTYYLDAKKNGAEQLAQKGKELANLIAIAKPDVVIAADDAASEFVVKPYLRNSRTPVVFVGINWDPKPYGYPMDNATGMTEVWPVQEVFRILRHTVTPLNEVDIITSENALERIDSGYIEKVAKGLGINIKHRYVKTFDEWKQAIVAAQSADAIHLGTNQSIRNWNEAEAIDWLVKHNQRFTFASQEFMLPYAMFSLSKSPEEFGSWAAKLSQTLLSGVQPWQIPVIPNQRFTPHINTQLLSLTPYQLPAHIKRNAILFEGNANP